MLIEVIEMNLIYARVDEGGLVPRHMALAYRDWYRNQKKLIEVAEMMDLIDVYFNLDRKGETVCVARNYTLVRDCVQNKLIRLLGGRDYKAVPRRGVYGTFESITVGDAVVRFESLDAGYSGKADYMLGEF